MKWILIILCTLLICSCEKVKPFQKAYINQESMKLSDFKAKAFETNFLSYREGGSGGNGGKAGGGCGCN
ncbi:MAG: hypothetical protein COA79_10415 [Planctomycetota bacterium]|nr:MAG: hypothetical protein COA79_10415 [Planctomycetota bacterium]